PPLLRPQLRPLETLQFAQPRDARLLRPAPLAVPQAPTQRVRPSPLPRLVPLLLLERRPLCDGGVPGPRPQQERAREQVPALPSRAVDGPLVQVPLASRHGLASHAPTVHECERPGRRRAC